MEHLEKIEMAAKDLIRYYCPLYSFVWDRSTRRKGQCRRDVGEIGVSRPIAKLNTFECMMLTVTHEIAHALTPRGHNEVWRAKCLAIGGDGKQYYDTNETVTPKKWVLYKNGVQTNIKRLRRINVPSEYTWIKEETLLPK